VNRDSFEIFKRMHYVCFHYEFEHDGFDPDEECDAGGCPPAWTSMARAHCDFALLDRADRAAEDTGGRGHSG
jgi:hypothetical protein